MAKRKYEHLIVTRFQAPRVEAPWAPGLSPVSKGKTGRILWLDSDVVPGAFYIETVWILPRPKEELAKSPGTRPHVHDYDEVIALFGTDLNDPYDLGAEAVLGIDDETYILNKTCLVFIPKGLRHGPLTFNRVDRPVFHFTAGTGKTYL